MIREGDLMSEEIRLISHQRDKYQKSNVLIGAVYKSTLLENKIMAISLNRIDKAYEDKEGSLILNFKVSELKQVLNIKGGSIYTHLNDVAKRMTGGRTIGFSDPEKQTFMYVPLITKAEFGNGEFSIRYAPEMKQYLKDMKKQYTLLSLKTMLKFDSVYSFRLYELLKAQCYYPRGTMPLEKDRFIIELDLSQLKFELGVINGELNKTKTILMKTGESGKPDYNLAEEKAEEQMYRDYSRFREKCLDVAIKEINAKTEMFIDYDTVKSGRGGKVVGIRFSVRVDEEKLKENGDFEKKIELTEEEIDEFVDRVMDITTEKIKVGEAKSIAKAAGYDIDVVQKACDYVEYMDYDNYVPYLLTVIKERYYEKSRKNGMDGKEADEKTLSFEDMKKHIKG